MLVGRNHFLKPPTNDTTVAATGERNGAGWLNNAFAIMSQGSNFGMVWMLRQRVNGFPSSRNITACFN